MSEQKGFSHINAYAEKTGERANAFSGFLAEWEGFEPSRAF